jgi:hypothetical protein
VAPEPEGSSPRSQQPANDPYPEPGESTPQPPPPKQDNIYKNNYTKDSNVLKRAHFSHF